jgi:hypothetical protein
MKRPRPVSKPRSSLRGGPRLFLPLSALGVTVACAGGGLTGAGPVTANTASTVPGVRYYLPRDIIVVEGAVTATRRRKIRSDLTLAPPAVSLLSTEAKVARRTVADDSVYYYLNVSPATTRDASLAVTVSPTGLLLSVGAEVKDRTGDAIVGIAKAVGTVIGSVALRDADAPSPEAVELVFSKTRASALKGDARRRAVDDLRSLPPVALLTLQDRPDARDLWDTRRERLADAAKLQQIKLDHLAKLNDKTGDAAKALISLLSGEINDLEARARAAGDALALLAVTYAADEKVATTTEVQPYAMALELGDIPEESILQGVSTTDSTKLIEVLSTKKPSQELFRRSLVLLTLRRLDPLGAQPSAGAAPDGGGTPIYFRQPRMYRLRVYGFTRALDPATKDASVRLRILDEQTLDLVARTDPVFAVAFPMKSFADGKLTLAFNEYGRLTRTEQSSTARLAAFAATAASAATALRDETAASLKKRQEIEESRRAIGLSAITRQVDSLTKAKQVLEMSTQIQGAASTSELTTKRQELEAQLSLLKAQANLDVADQSGTASSDTALLQAQIDQLKAQIELLKQQTELERLRQEAAKNQP